MKPRSRDALLVFVATFAIYLLFRSRFYIGDGIRYLPAMLNPALPRDGGNGHFIWPYVGWSVLRVCTALGVPFSAGDGPVNTGAIGMVQGASALLGAAGLSFLYLWLRDVASRRAALTAVAIAGLSHAYLLHATDMTEPIAAVPPMMLGLWLLNRIPDRTWARLLVGVLLGLGAAGYEIALLAVAPAAWLAARPAPPSIWPKLSRLVRVGVEIGGASIATFAGLIAATRYLTPVSKTAPAGLTGNALFGSLNPRHFVAGVFGFANSLAEIPSAGGMSNLFHESPRNIVKTLVITVLAMAFLAGLALRLWRSRACLVAGGHAPEIVAAAGWFVLVALTVCYWAPLYEKFWVFSVPPLALAVALAIDTAADGTPEAPSASEARWPWFLAPVTIVLLITVVTGAIPRRFGHNGDVDAATRLGERVTPADVLVVPGWDSPSVCMRNILKHPVDCVDLTDGMLAVSLDATAFERDLATQVDAAHARGGHVYFLTLLGDTRADWNAFYGSNLHIPYEAFDQYRAGAVAVETFPTEPPVVLYEAPGPARASR